MPLSTPPTPPSPSVPRPIALTKRRARQHTGGVMSGLVHGRLDRYLRYTRHKAVDCLSHPELGSRVGVQYAWK